MSTQTTTTTKTVPPLSSADREYLLYIPDHPDVLSKRRSLLQLHNQNAIPLVKAGRCPFFGSTLAHHSDSKDEPTAENGTLMIIKAENEESIRETIKEDVFTVEGVWDFEKLKIWPFQKRSQNHQPENPFSNRIPGQTLVHIPSFTLESGVEMHNVPVACMSWGTLSPRKDNVLVVCHALSGSANVSEWWGPLLGRGKAFDTDKFFIVCMNSLGSPYGSASPVTAKNGNAVDGLYGADFPVTTIRDDVRLHKLLLDDLGIHQVAAVIGGSMGGMLVLEWAYLGPDYVRCIVPIATSSHQSAWGIGWDEAQRHAIYSDRKYQDGRYHMDDPPVGGLKAARMAALLTYRSRDSLERRFGRDLSSHKKPVQPQEAKAANGEKKVSLLHHHRGHHDRREKEAPSPRITSTPHPTADESTEAFKPMTSTTTTTTNPHYAAQSYLQYQASKFSDRFDSNCYIALTHKLDSHDISRGRAPTMAEALALIQQPTLVLGIRSDGLYTLAEQELIARHVPHADLQEIVSEDGHDAFLIESKQLNGLIIDFLLRHLPDIM